MTAPTKPDRNVRYREWRGKWSRRLLDALAALTPRRRRVSPRRRIGVLLTWGIGDTVMILPFLQALRQAYPEAEIVGLGHPWLPDLVAGEGLFDSIETLVPPWTRHSGKYRLWSSEWRHFARRVRALRRAPFDLLASVRPDPRDALLARILACREFAGIADCGGRAWTSVDLGAGPGEVYRLYGGELSARAARILCGIDISPMPRFRPRDAHRPPAERPLLGISFGASHPIKRWHEAGIAAALAGMATAPACALVIGHDHSPTVQFPAGWRREDWRGSLTELKALLPQIDVLFCSDSGVMHMAAASGCRVVALFTTGMLSRFAPPDQRVYAVEPMPCRPCGDTCIHPTLLCVERIETAMISAMLDDALNDVTAV
jgi:ADP-heptose:LPS heptosyltransferase